MSGIKQIDGWQILTSEGYKPFYGVEKIQDKKVILKISLADDTSISVARGHVFIVDGTEEMAMNLIVGECLQTLNGLVEITKIEEQESDFVYDILHVESSDNSYYCNGILNHNCKFLGSSNTLIDGEVLERTAVIDPIEYKLGGTLLIYEKPQEGAMYIIGVDTSKGTARDFSVIQVLKIIDEMDIHQVAMYRCNTISPNDFAQVCIEVSTYYNEAYMMVENNDIGASVADVIWFTYEYDKILNCDPKGIGIRSTRKTKLAANMLMKRYLENGWLTLNDKQTLLELSRFEEISPDVFGAKIGDHDDCVAALLWALYFISTTFFDGRDNSVKVIDPKFRLDSGSIEDEGPPVIFDNQGGANLEEYGDFDDAFDENYGKRQKNNSEDDMPLLF